MNYRHAFHAGNFADVVKHATLARVIAHLREKPGAFRILDTHAGGGLTDLTGPEATRTGEWRDGIGRLLVASLTPQMRDLLAPYLTAVERLNEGGRLIAYPGSPLLAQALMRPQDRLTACELAPDAAAGLTRHLANDPRTKLVRIDGWTALSAYLPPRERRGVVVIDPPFEHPDELDRLLDAVATAHRKWATGIYLVWYPIKEPRRTDAFARKLVRLGIPKMLRAQLSTAPPRPTERLTASGLIIINPPWKLEGELQILLSGLAPILAREPPGRFRLDWLTGEI